MTVQIKFGTDGWRAAIAEDYTFDSVRRATQGFADYLKATYTPAEVGRGVVVGGDRRFLSEHFAATVAEVLAGNDIYTGKSVILAMGTARVAPLPGEEDLVGRGVSYCATCDGMFYKDGTVLVIASDEEAVEEAVFLSTLAKVLYVKERPHNTAGLPPQVRQLPGKPLKLLAKGEQLVLETDQGEVTADGAFILRPAVAMTQLIPEVQTENGRLVLDNDLMTSVPGVFAAGDITGAPLQAAKAAGEGNIAVLAAARHLTRRNNSAGENQ